MSHEDAAAWLRTWDSQGWHRTATEADSEAADWLAREATKLGAAPVIESFALERVDPIETFLELDGARIDAVPVFDAPATGPGGITGTLGPAGSDAAIGVAELPPRAVYSGEYRALRMHVSHRALVIVCQGSQPGLSLLNAEQFHEPYGAPVIHVASDARDRLLEAVARGDTARVVADYRRTPASARNVVVTIPGVVPGQTPVVVMTPRSAWWQSTAERGGGLVCWLETVRGLVADTPSCDVVLTANSGHELGHLGLDDFMARRPGWERPVEHGGAIWVHWGANLGAADGVLTVLSNSDALRAMAAAELVDAGQPPDIIAPKTHVPSGETRDIQRAGGRYVTLVGSNKLFHMPQDRWPDAVDVAAVARIAAAASRLVVALTR